ncbi:SAM-dependent methyltransferase [Leptospira sp. GIMC2001]|nr:SAM-dependent methyltransferase [Leptospira sp. GIMC2001]WCL48569.1 SAM-dependent methyltransferase [Leptospira sp. GIMC2001]
MSAKIQIGNFYVVATPIGNKADITLRAIEKFKEVDLILCEDSRTTIPLLKDLGITTQAKTLHRSSDPNYFEWIYDGLRKGQSYCLVSDAGTPGLSDPGSNVVRFLRSKNISCIPIPGASALAAIVSISGFQANPTIFLGFLSEKKRKETVSARSIQANRWTHCLLRICSQNASID